MNIWRQQWSGLKRYCNDIWIECCQTIRNKWKWPFRARRKSSSRSDSNHYEAKGSDTSRANQKSANLWVCYPRSGVAEAASVVWIRPMHKWETGMFRPCVLLLPSSTWTWIHRTLCRKSSDTSWIDNLAVSHCRLPKLWKLPAHCSFPFGSTQPNGGLRFPHQWHRLLVLTLGLVSRTCVSVSNNVCWLPKWLHFISLRVLGTHQLNAGSSVKPWLVTYSATPTGFDSFSNDRGSQVVVPSFHSIQNFQPSSSFDVFFVLLTM
jgi:hypothetical protein